MSKAITIDLDVAMKQFKKRKKANSGKQVDNSSLYAGSPMYYYCRYCGELTEVLSESHWGSPKRVCDPCDVLHQHGLV